jgi:hypothetical protein
MKHIPSILIGLCAATSLTWAAERNLLIEKSTDVDCGPCPGAAIYLDSLKNRFGERIIHVDWHYDDAMSSTEIYDIYMSYWRKGFPNLNLERTTGKGLVDFDANSSSRWNSIVDTVEQRLSQTSPLRLKIEHTYNASTRTISGKVIAEFDQAANLKDPRIGLMLVQDSIVGPNDGSVNQGTAAGNAKRYMQKNYYADSMYTEASWVNRVLQPGATATALQLIKPDPIMGDIHKKTYPIFGYVHRNVYRSSLLGGIWGQSGILPTAAQAGNRFEAPFEAILPEQYDGFKGQTLKGLDALASVLAVPAHMKLVAFVSAEGEKNVVQATGVNLLTSELAANTQTSVPHQMAFSNGSLFLPESGQLKVWNAQGRLLLKATTSASTHFRPKLESGLYLLQFTGKSGEFPVLQIAIP